VWNKNFGFSLLEILIVLVLISLLVGIGITQYQHFILKARRSDAQTSLLDYHARLQRCFVMTHSYRACIDIENFPQPSLNGFYEIQALDFDLKKYTLQAIVNNYQQNDSVCYRFTINQFHELLAYNQLEQVNLACWSH